MARKWKFILRDPNLTANEKLVGVAISSAQHADLPVFISDQQIALLASVSRATVIRCRRTLAARGYLSSDATGRYSITRVQAELFDPPEESRNGGERKAPQFEGRVHTSGLESDREISGDSPRAADLVAIRGTGSAGPAQAGTVEKAVQTIGKALENTAKSLEPVAQSNSSSPLPVAPCNTYPELLRKVKRLGKTEDGGGGALSPAQEAERQKRALRAAGFL